MPESRTETLPYNKKQWSYTDGAPKKALSAYTYYLVEQRRSPANRLVPFGELAQSIGKSWGALDTAGKVKWSKLAVADRARYDREKKEWIDGGRIAAPMSAAERRRRRAAQGVPKQVRSAYTYFVKEQRPIAQRAKKPTDTFGDIARLIAAKWAALRAANGAGLKKYNDLAAVDRERYTKESEVYKKSCAVAAAAAETKKRAAEAVTARKRAAAKVLEQKAKKKKRAGPKQPLSAYTFYVVATRSLVMAEDRKRTFAEVARLVGQRWQALSGDDRKLYTTKAEKDKVRFTTEKAAWVAAQKQRTQKLQEKARQAWQHDDMQDEASSTASAPPAGGARAPRARAKSKRATSKRATSKRAAPLSTAAQLQAHQVEAVQAVQANAQRYALAHAQAHAQAHAHAHAMAAQAAHHAQAHAAHVARAQQHAAQQAQHQSGMVQPGLPLGMQMQMQMGMPQMMHMQQTMPQMMHMQQTMPPAPAPSGRRQGEGSAASGGSSSSTGGSSGGGGADGSGGVPAGTGGRNTRSSSKSKSAASAPIHPVPLLPSAVSSLPAGTSSTVRRDWSTL